MKKGVVMTRKILSLYAISVVLGLLTGVVASLFQMAIGWLDSLLHILRHFIEQKQGVVAWYSALMSMLMLLSAWLMVHYYAPEGTLLHKRPIFWHRLLPVKFFAGVLSLSAQMVMGREGPTIQLGGNMGQMLSDFCRLSQHRGDTLIAAGSAAGLAAAFNAPLAGVLFVMEEMRDQFNYSFLNFQMVVICCVSATIAMQAILGSGPAIQMEVFALSHLSSLGYFLIFGCVVGLMGLAFNKCLMKVLHGVDSLTRRTKLLYVLLVGALVGYLAVVYPQVVGGGYEIIAQALQLSPTFSVILVLLCARLVMTLLSYSTGVPGGIFAPMLALGTLLGLGAFEMFHFFIPDESIHPGMFAVAGMGALFAASVRSPVTGVVLVVEMTQNYSLILPLMISCIASATVVQVAKNAPIYSQLLRRRLYLDKHNK